MKKSFWLAVLILLPVTIVLTPFSGCKTAQLEAFEETREMMDTYIRVVIYTEEEKAQDILNAAFARMEEIEQIATSWDSEGEAYKLNEQGFLDNASPELIEMIEYSIEYNELTDGYFDITVQPLLDLYTFNPNAEKQFWELDKDTQTAMINEKMKVVGSEKIIIENGSVRLPEGGKITLGGIAKGYAGDEAAEVIAGMGVKHAMIDAGGDIRTLGSKPDGTLWNIALVNPDDTTQYLADIYVSGKAVTTSGSYARYFSPDKKANHILNPKTGFSSPGSISATIIADTGVMADALATGVMAMGPEMGMALIESLDGVEAMMVDADKNIHESSGLSQYLK